ncbi:MAG TPA: hypothetical protein ENJ18_12925 [Nannocystis exedens]|nr:hypothetical protein [Nannocystis exedens]
MTKRPLVARVQTWTRLVTIAAILPLACGDDSQASGSDSDTANTGQTSLTGTSDTSATATSTATSTATDSDSGTDSEGNTTGTTATTNSSESDTGTASGTTTTTTTGDTSTSTTGVSASDTDATTTTTGDTTTGSTTGPNCDGMGGEENALSVIWIANSAQGTVSKIDTKTGEELGRYMTRPNTSGSPSRTSVNRYGDVAVANRNGGVTKIIAREEKCIDANNDGFITTSTGPNDVLAWGEDECIAWHTPIAHNDNRPIAWTPGVFNEETCLWEDLHVWSAWSDKVPGSAVVTLLDGEDGSTIQEVPIPDLPNPWPGWHGFYGAAVDGDGNAWFSQLEGSNPQQSWLVRVNLDDFSYDHWTVGDEGGYGMTVTSEGYVWICGRKTRRFNPMTETWTVVQTVNGGIHTGGCMGDGDGILYRGAYNQILGIDTSTMEIVKTLNVGQPGDDHIWGVAVDFEGKVWGVPRNGSRAYKVDPITGVIELTFQGLVGAYTYSDMTGFALFNVKPA